MAQQNSLELTVREDKRIVEKLLNEKGYYFPMASHHVSEQKVWDKFMQIFDNNEFATAGACGNMQHESGLYSDNAENEWNERFGHTDEWLTQNINDGSIDLSEFLQTSWWVNDYGFGYGLSQWTDTTRRTLLWNRTIDDGLDIDDEDAQLDYIEWEFTEGAYTDVRTGMIQCTTVEEATRYYCSEYEVGAWNDNRLTYAEYFMLTYGSGANTIHVSSTGNGTAYVDNEHPLDGADFVLTATPAYGETLIDITATDSHGYSIAMDVIPVRTYQYNAGWGKNIYISVEFSGETPPPPPPPTFIERHHMAIWMYPMFRR